MSFVHQSAVEFLQNTENKQQLLSCDLSRVDRRIQYLTLAEMFLGWLVEEPVLSSLTGLIKF